MYYYLILDQFANDDVYSTLVHDGIFHVDHKMVMQKIEWKHMTFSLIFAVHIFCLEHDNHALSISFYYLVFCLCRDLTSHLQVMDLKYVFDVIL